MVVLVLMVSALAGAVPGAAAARTASRPSRTWPLAQANAKPGVIHDPHVVFVLLDKGYWGSLPSRTPGRLCADAAARGPVPTPRQ